MGQSVEVEIRVPSDAPAGQEATIYVSVEDVTEADAPAKVVAHTVMRNVRLAPDSTLHATIDVADQDVRPNGQYSVRVHADTKGDGRVGRGDYISTQSHPVLTYGYPRRVSVTLKRVV